MTETKYDKVGKGILDKLPLTRTTERLLKEGKIDEAKAFHTRAVKEQFDRAAQGEVINLSDLMASHEEINYAIIKRTRQ